ncbi:hypothetical protein [Algibacter sp. 2305UL17-15]|uniref:hypothetical protein n=1 Tax=Algibacter sp. 2305UL17-15 TaxID=3231268 RepID=UPI00345B4195
MYSSRSNILIGFHGCDESARDQLLTKPNNVKISEKPFDWLGHGFYIWENNYDRALEWAKDKQERGKIKKASVIGVVFTLPKNPTLASWVFYKHKYCRYV